MNRSVFYGRKDPLNENGPRATGRRPYVKLTCLFDDCHCKYWFKEYVSIKQTYVMAGVIENENGPCARNRGPRITGQNVLAKEKSREQRSELVT